MAPTKTATKVGRGRPKKVVTDSPTASKPVAAAETDGDDSAPAKRGPGRAKGVTGSKVTKKSAPVPGRGRGRPPKDPNAPRKSAYVPTGKPRGRPPGVGAGKKKVTASPKKATKVSRGGPKSARQSNVSKSDAGNGEDDDEAELSKHQSDEEELGEDAEMDDSYPALREVGDEDDEEDGGE